MNAATQLQTKFAHNTGHNVSQKYVAVNTGMFLGQMESLGYELSGFSKAKVRRESKDGFQKHLLRFRKTDVKALNTGDAVPEIVIVNSYDGSSAVRIFGGVYRFVCANGLMLGTDYGHYRIVHVGASVLKDVSDAVFSIESRMELLNKNANRMKNTLLTDFEQFRLAETAAKMILPEHALNASISDLLKVRRDADKKNDLWTVFNRIQETAINGGLRYQIAVNGSDGQTGLRNCTTRRIVSIDRTVEVNINLFSAAEKLMAEI